MDHDAFWQVHAVWGNSAKERSRFDTWQTWQKKMLCSLEQVEMLNADDLALRTGRTLDELAPDEQELAGAGHRTFDPATWYTHPLQVRPNTQSSRFPQCHWRS
jgi:hypothetical protein